MTDHEEIRNLLRAILGELRVANEIAIRNLREPPICYPYVPIRDVVRAIREEYNTP